MTKLLPAPLLSACLFVMWLVLQGSAAPGDILLALALALAIPVLSSPLRPLAVRIRRPLVVTRLVLTVGWDVLKSNLDVARGVFRSPWREPRGDFVRVPLELKDPNGLAALCAITTVVPGTVWSEFSLESGILLLHVFDLDGEAAFIEHFKTRYEQPLKEIFE